MDSLRWRRKCSEGILGPTVAASDSPWTDWRPDTTQNLSETIEDKLHEALKLARRLMNRRTPCSAPLSLNHNGSAPALLPTGNV